MCVWNRSIHSWCGSQQSTALPTLSFSGSQITLGVAFSQLSSEDLMANYPQINISLLRRGRHRGNGRLSLLIEGLKKEEKRVWSKPSRDGPTSCFPSAATSSSPEEPVGSLKIIIIKICCTEKSCAALKAQSTLSSLNRVLQCSLWPEPCCRLLFLLPFFFKLVFMSGK